MTASIITEPPFRTSKKAEEVGKWAMWIDFVSESEISCRRGHLEGLGAPESSLGVLAPSLPTPDGDYGAYGWRERRWVSWREGLRAEESCVSGGESPATLACPLTP